MSRNPILIGTAEEIDLVMPRVREVLAQEGIWIGGDTARPEFTIPLSVHNGEVYSMVEDAPLDPERFLPTVTFHGPYLVGDDKARDAKRMRLLMSLDVRYGGECGDSTRPYYARLSKGDRSSTATGATLAELADTAAEWLAECASDMGIPK